MRTREELEQRVADLERQLAAGGGRVRGSRRSAPAGSSRDFPSTTSPSAPTPRAGEARGHARGFIALGDIATGVIAAGGLARGILAAGGCAVGLVTFGGLSVGALLAFGGLAIGGVAFGGGAIGGVAMGGGAAGYYACGGGAVGEHVVAPYRIDPEAQRFFAEYLPAAGSALPGCATGAR